MISLGVYYDSKLDFAHHVLKMRGDALQILGFIMNFYILPMYDPNLNLFPLSDSRPQCLRSTKYLLNLYNDNWILLFFNLKVSPRLMRPNSFFSNSFYTLTSLFFHCNYDDYYE